MFGGSGPQKVEEIGKRGESSGRKGAKSVNENTWEGALHLPSAHYETGSLRHLPIHNLI